MRKSAPLPPTQLQITISNFGLHESDKINLVIHDTKLEDAYTYMLSICTDPQVQLANMNILNAYEMTLHLNMTAVQARRLCLLFMLAAVYAKIGEKIFVDPMFLSNIRPLCVRYLGNIFGTMSFRYVLRYAGNFFVKEETDQYLYKSITNTKVFDEVVKFKQCVTEIRTLGFLADPSLHYEAYKEFYNSLCDNSEFGSNDNTARTLQLFKALVDKRLRNSVSGLESRWSVYKSFAKRLSININNISHICFSMLLYELKETGDVIDLPMETRHLTMLEKATKLLINFDVSKDNQEILKELSSIVKYSVCLTTLGKLVAEASASSEKATISQINYAKDLVRVRNMKDLETVVISAFARLEV